MHTIEDHAQALEAGTISARELVETSLARIADPAGEGARAFIAVHAGQAQAMADAADTLRRAGRALSRYAGIPVGLKDLCDIKGDVTTAGSRALADAAPATAHAPVVARLVAAGFIPVGRTNMTEFAFSGLGINPHYGTPKIPWDRDGGRIPGGSSSGTAVAVADGMIVGGLGTDTGGSCRIPAAFCGVVGYKPTARRVPTAGVVPLSTSLDSIGPLANSVMCCAAMDAVMAGEDFSPPVAASLTGLRLGLVENFFLDAMDATVSATFDRALIKLSAAGARVVRMRLPVLDDYVAANTKGGFAAAEAYAWHRTLLARAGEKYDPHVRARIERGAQQSAADFIDLLAARARITAAANAATAGVDALVMPTTPIVPPRIADLDDEREYGRVNLLLLRNCAVGNFLDRCAISLPCHAPGEAPVGLMLVGETMGDAKLFSIARAVEAALV
ncbi:MAG: amidase [Acetobacteraceae bacterium]|nr:amidase [Acetobacteraceae bacterium]